MPASASAICERAESDAAFCASAVADVASNCCWETSSFASSPRSRSTSRADFAALASSLAQTRLRGDETRACRLDFLFRRRHAALRLRDAAACRRHVAGGGRRGDRDRALRRHGVRFRVGELGARLVDGDLIVARVELDQQRARFDELVVVDGDRRHGAADARGDLRDVRVHLRIVRAFAAGGGPGPDAGAEDEEQHGADDQANARLLDECHREPPRSRRSRSSVVPTPRTSAPLARS